MEPLTFLHPCPDTCSKINNMTQKFLRNYLFKLKNITIFAMLVSICLTFIQIRGLIFPTHQIGLSAVFTHVR